MADQFNKVFGIGLSKTGTTSLGRCFVELGLKRTSFSLESVKMVEDFLLRNDFSKAKKVADQFEAFEDWPWPVMYKKLDQEYPGSKFILTVRKDPETWLNSLKKHSIKNTSPFRNTRKLVYGYRYPHGHEQEYIDFYNRHRQEIHDYFRDRSEDFIELCWEKGDGWEELCQFLGTETPNRSFPHANKGTDKKGKYYRIAANKILSALPL